MLVRFILDPMRYLLTILFLLSSFAFAEDEPVIAVSEDDPVVAPLKGEVNLLPL